MVSHPLVLEDEIHKYKYTNKQIHKYSLGQFCNMTLQVLYFWKCYNTRTSKTMFWHANTQIHHMKDPTCGISLKRGLFKDFKNDIPMYQKRKYKKYKNTNTEIHKHTNTQIQHMTNCQKNPPCGIFLKRGLFKDVQNDIPICQKRKYSWNYWILMSGCWTMARARKVYVCMHAYKHLYISFSIDIVCTEIE